MRSLKRIPWFEATLAVIVIGVHLYAALSDAYNFPSNWFNRDDAYYYFKVAQNITEGRGSTFDGINPTNGYHPLWMLVCIPVFALARFDLILPLRILLVLQGCLSAATAILMYRLIRGSLSHPVAILAGAWWAFDIYIHGTLYEVGLETGLASFTVTLLVYLLWKTETRWRTEGLSRGALAGLALAACLALLSRLDLVFLALLAGLWILLRGTPMRTLLPFDLLAAAAGILLAFVSRLGLPDYFPYSSAAMFMLAASISTKVLLYFFLGLYQPPAALPLPALIGRSALAVTLSSIAIVAGMFGLSSAFGTFPRSALLLDWGFNLLAVIGLRLIARAFAQNREAAATPPLEVLRRHARRSFEEAVVFFGITGAVLGAYMLWNKIVIGTASPVSGLVKRWWGDFPSRVYGGTARDLSSFWGLGFENDFDTWRPFSAPLQTLSHEIAARLDSLKPELYYPPLILLCLLIGTGLLFLNRKMAGRGAVQLALPLLLTASFAQVLSYNITGYAGMKEWYWISEPIFAVLALSLILSILIKPLEKLRRGQLALYATAGLAGLALAWGLGDLIIRRMPYGAHASGLPYMDSAQFLEQNTPPGSIIGLTGGGNVGYFIRERTIVNMDGLINSPDYFEALKDGRASEFLSGIGVDYLFANPEILRGLPYRGQYHMGQPLAQFGGKALMELLP